VLVCAQVFLSAFDFDPELVARLLRAGHTIHEIPERYQPPTFKEGKKRRRA
jgi:hypothetical protein